MYLTNLNQTNHCICRSTHAQASGPFAPCVFEAFLTSVDPDQLLKELLVHVHTPPLREFLSAVVHEPEIRQVLTTLAPKPEASVRQTSTCTMSYPSECLFYAVEALRRAASVASYWTTGGVTERDVLFVATVLQGLHPLIQPLVQGDAEVSDVLLTLVRGSLHRLDVQAPGCAYWLRIALGWSNEDDIDPIHAPRLRHLVQKALAQTSFQRRPAPALPVSLTRPGASQCLSNLL